MTPLLQHQLTEIVEGAGVDVDAEPIADAARARIEQFLDNESTVRQTAWWTGPYETEAAAAPYPYLIAWVAAGWIGGLALLCWVLWLTARWCGYLR